MCSRIGWITSSIDWIFAQFIEPADENPVFSTKVEDDWNGSMHRCLNDIVTEIARVLIK